MAINRSVPGTKNSVQNDINWSFDEDFGVLAVEGLVYNPSTCTIDRMVQNPTSLPLPSGAATSANQTTEIAELQVLNSLIPTKYDYIALSYTGSNLTGVVFKLGGSGGTTAATLTLAYTGSNLTSVTKT